MRDGEEFVQVGEPGHLDDHGIGEVCQVSNPAERLPGIKYRVGNDALP